MFLGDHWKGDAAGLRQTLDQLRSALERPLAVVGRRALGYDRERIKESLQLVLGKIDSTDLTAARARSGFVREFRPTAQLTSLQTFFAELQTAWEKRVARILGGRKLAALAKLLAAATPDLLRILGREDHENSHSDLIAWLLSPKRAPNVAPHAIRSLVSCFDDRAEWHDRIASAISKGLVSVRREMMIGRELANADDLCRADIVLSGPGFVLAIENKIWSHEHSDQTTTYWRWLEPMRCLRGGLFLSPSGLTASCPAFPAVSYLDLISALLEGPATTDITFGEEMVLASYLKTLARYIVPVEINAALNAARAMEAK